MRARKIDNEQMKEILYKERRQAIDEERRRRYHKVTAEIPTPDRQLGEQDITDIPTDNPWQKIVDDQLGVPYPINTDWVCPRCGLRTIGSFPREICPVCGYKSPLSKVNLRR